MNLRTFGFILGGAVAVVSLSCRLKSVFSDSDKAAHNLKDSHQQVRAKDVDWAQEPTPAEREQEQGEQQAADTAAAFMQPKPLDPTPKKDFPPREDSNGVIIEKKNGVLITRISRKEVYYLPDEF